MAEPDEAAGGVRLRLALGHAEIGSALIRRRDWSRDPVLQSRLLCREMEILRAASSLDLLESARRAAAKAFAGEESAGAKDRGDATAASMPVPPTTGAPDLARPVELGAPLRQLLMRADAERGELRLPDSRFATDARLWVHLSELRGLGLVEPDRRTLTVSGASAAAALQAERDAEERILSRGLPFASYRAGDGALLAEWSTGVAGGAGVYGDERFIARGDAPSAARREQPLADFARRWAEAVAPAQRQVAPVAFSGTGPGRRVWFTDGSSVAADVFDHVTGGRLDMSFTTGAGGALNVYRFGERVAVIEIENVEAPEGVRAALEAEAVRTTPRSGGHFCRGQGTLPFGCEFALAIGPLSAGASPLCASGSYEPESELARQYGFTRGHMAAIHDDVGGLLDALGEGDGVGERVGAFGDTKLMLAVEAERFQMVLNLWRLGERAEARNRRGVTALMGAACVGSVDLVCLVGLMLGGVPPEDGLDAQDGDGNTAMHWAAREGHRLAVDCLRWLGARADLRNKEGRTPEEEAREFEHPTTAAACRSRKIVEPKFSSVEVAEILRLMREHRMARLDLSQPGGAALAGGGPSVNSTASSGALREEERLAS
jgi:hypothetical protein